MSLFQTSRALAFRPRAFATIQSPVAASWRRNYATDPNQSGGAGPNMNQQEHISEEAAKIEKIRGGSGPDLEMGTPVQEVCQWPRAGERQVVQD
jgi:small subunit ribosomal protein S7